MIGPSERRQMLRLNAHDKIGQDQDHRRLDTRPNQGREPPLVWSIEFVKKVHVDQGHCAAGVPFGGACDGPSLP